MKNTIFLLIAFLVAGAAVKAQSTVDSIAAKYQLLPMPEALTIEKTFPVLGTYQLNAGDNAQAVVITMDEQNKGIIWVEGLPEGKFKAYLKQSPATYRVIAQKTSTGKQIPEGTLIYDPAASSLNVALGKSFDASDPAAIFRLAGTSDLASSGSSELKVKSKNGSAKKKTRVQIYSAVRSEQGTAVVPGAAAASPKTIQ